MLSFWRRSSRDSPPPPPPPARHPQGGRDFSDLTLRSESDPGNRVRYASKTENVQFMCSFPANSPHLAEAQKLSLEIFTSRQAQRQAIEENRSQRSQPLLIRENVEPYGGRRSPAQPEVRRSMNMRQSESPKPERASRRRSTLFEDFDPEMAPDEYPRQRRARRPISGQKHTSDTHETYILSGGEGRKLLASAPVGSRVARYHDQIAAHAGNEVSSLKASRVRVETNLIFPPTKGARHSRRRQTHPSLHRGARACVNCTGE